MCFAAALQGVRAQNSGATQQVDDMQERRQRAQMADSYIDGSSAPELYPDESSDVGPQTVLRMKPRRTLFEAMADVQYFYTDNMFLTEKQKHDADVLANHVPDRSPSFPALPKDPRLDELSLG